MSLFPGSQLLEHGELDNRGVDWVLHYSFENVDLAEAIAEFRELIADLEHAHLQTQVRHGHGASLLICVRVPRDRLGRMVYQSRVKDWLFGIAHELPVGSASSAVEAETPAEALRSVYHAVTWQKQLGGAGVIPNHGRWEHVTAAFPLHDPAANAELLRKWSYTFILEPEDLDAIRALFGEKVAFYFAFIHCYSVFLLFPAAWGILCWWYFGSYSITFAVGNCLWCLVFVEYWKIREADLSLRWNVKGVGILKVNRAEYVWDREVRDAITGETVQVFPGHKQFLRQLLLIPFASIASVVLGSLIVVSFALEVFIAEVYTGPFKSYLEFFPTVVFSLMLPFISNLLTSTAKKLTDYENYRTQDQYELAQTAKTFVMNFITAFLPTMLTAFVYVPFGARLLPSLLTLDCLSGLIKHPASIRIDASRLQQEVIYLSAMAQVLSFGEEVILPYIKRVVWQQYRDWRHAHTRPRHNRALSMRTDLLLADTPSESAFVSRIRNEADADEYNVQEDILEMCVQFGYLALFAVAWPLVPLGFLINNWLELRGDFFKLSLECQRPPPIRTDSIGPSLQGLEVLTWLGSLSTAAILYLYREGRPQENFSWSELLLTILAAEWAYLAARFAVHFGLQKIATGPVRGEIAKRYKVRKSYLEAFSGSSSSSNSHSSSRSRSSSGSEKGGSPKLKPRVRFQDRVAVYGSGSGVKNSSEEELRDSSDEDGEESFWSRQPCETADAGVRLIRALSTSKNESKEKEKGVKAQ